MFMVEKPAVGRINPQLDPAPPLARLKSSNTGVVTGVVGPGELMTHEKLSVATFWAGSIA
jgi:hypothetical protein